MSGVSFGSPYLLAALVVPAAALAAYLWIGRRPSRQTVAFPNLGVLATVAGRPGRRRHVVAGLLLGALVVLCVAVARPRVPLAATAENATVVLVVDVSVSMNAKDVRPTRLEAARAAIRSFVERVPGSVKVGLVAFADDPVVITSPTTDRDLLESGIASLSPGFGTAIGDALARGVELVRQSTAEVAPSSAPPTSASRPKGAVVLLSDGTQTRGILSPEEAAGRAKQAGIPVDTIALGTDTGTVTLLRDGMLVTVAVPPDRETLAAIAEATGGSTFAVQDAGRLSSVYRRLGTTVARTTRPREVTSALVGAAAALLAAAIGIAALTAPRLP